MRWLLLKLLPGDENWLWRRLACLSSVGVMLHCCEVAAGAGDAAVFAQAVIGLGVALGAYVGGSVTDDHLKRKADGGPTT